MHFEATVYYTIISKFQKLEKKLKNTLIIKRNTSQVNDIILDACMKCENYLIKTEGQDAFYRHYIYIAISKISKNGQKYKNNPIVKT